MTSFLTMRWLRFGGVILMATFIGCGMKPSANYQMLNLVQVTGRVTLDGQPLAKAVVTFDDSDGTFSFGMTDSAGYYSLKLDSVAKGCKPGAKVVRISTARKILGLNSAEEGGERGGEGDEKSSEPAKERLPVKYHKKSELRAEVSSSHRKFDFDLKSDGMVADKQN